MGPTEETNTTSSSKNSDAAVDVSIKIEDSTTQVTERYESNTAVVDTTVASTAQTTFTTGSKEEFNDELQEAKSSIQKTSAQNSTVDEEKQLLCENPLDTCCIEAPSQPDKRGYKRKTIDGDLPGVDEDVNGSRKKPSIDANATETIPATPTPLTSVPVISTPMTTTPGNFAATPEIEPRSASRIKSCLVEGCEKLRAKSGYCLRHFKDRKAPIRSGPAEYERRICVIEGCERLRSKGDHCHRHHKDPNAPIRNKSDGPADRKKKCSIENCDRLQVKGGFCSRHFRNRSAPVLTTPAFSFDAHARWDELFPQLQAFYNKNGHSRVPTSQKTDLARFVVHIRCVYRTKKQKKLKADQNAATLAVAAKAAGDTADTPGETPASLLEDVCEPVPAVTTAAKTVHPDLTKSKLLTPERMEALKTVNFEFQLWTVEPSQWEQRFQELLAYCKQNGNFHVTNKQNATLSSWCKTQRQRYKNTMAIYQGLYGVELTCPQKKAKELYVKAKEKAREMKAAAAASGDSNKQSLISVPTLSDIGEAKNMMDPERICKLNAVGFEWELQKDTYVESWENRYNQLLKFKVINGHCRVPKSSGDNPQLGQWVKQMRKYHGWKEDGKPYPTTFTDERITRLNELGFEWRLKETPMKSGIKAEDNTATPVARILNTQLNNSVDVAPLQQFQPPGGVAISLGGSNNNNANGNNGENGQSMNWAWGNNGYDANNSAGV